MSSLFERMMALNTPGPYTAERVTAETALTGGRHPVLPEPQPNTVLGTPLVGVGTEAGRQAWRDALETRGLADRLEEIVLGLGCFWGVERLYWGVEGVYGTSVGYAGGYTVNPTYREVCTGRTGHAEVVRIVFDPEVVSTAELLQVAFENHNPSQGDRQGNDVGTQYRSCVYTTTPEQLETAHRAIAEWSKEFEAAGYGAITTEVAMLMPAADAQGLDAATSSNGPEGVGDGEYYLAEEEHQQYLQKNPGGYCNHGSNGVSCQISF